MRYIGIGTKDSFSPNMFQDQSMKESKFINMLSNLDVMVVSRGLGAFPDWNALQTQKVDILSYP